VSTPLPAGVSVEPVSHRPPVAVRPVLLHQHWADVVFLHWPVPVERVVHLMPAGVHPDVHGGTTWVGLVHFRMVRLGFGPLPGLPWLGDFAETNVRLYSVDDEGRRGVVFRSLDADRGLPVLGARGAAALPYSWAPSRVHVERSAGAVSTVRYDTVRRWPGPRGTATHTQVRVGGPIAEPTELEHFLTARWALHTSRLGPRGRTTVRWPNEHPQWQLHAAELEHLTEDAVAAGGLPGVTDAPPASVLYSPGLPVRFGPWRRVRTR
jgi:uncharacterized protein YqjF (DUF2071 family)